MVEDPALPWAAVAVILVPSPDSLLLIRRAERPGDPWSGHLALPGGRFSPADVDLVATAIRETFEEVGVDLEGAPLLGALDDIAPRDPLSPAILVRPFVLTLPEPPLLRLNSEVTSTHWIPLNDLSQPGVHGPVTVAVGGASRTVPGYRLQHGVVWGMTERILQLLLATA